MNRVSPLLRLAFLCSALAAVAAPSQYPGSTPVPAHLKKGFSSINEKDCKAWLTILASDELGGRGTGQPGFQKAAEFIAARFKEFGLKPVGDNGTYFQNVPFQGTRLNPSSSYITCEGTGEVIMANGAFTIGSFASSAEGEGNAIFLKLSGNDPKIPDSASLDDAVVIVAAKKSTSALRRQLATSGAALVLTVSAEAPSSDWSSRPPGRQPRNSRVLQGAISNEAAKKLAAGCGVDAEVVDINIPASTSADVRTGTRKIRFVAKAESKTTNVPNVVGLIEGSDPALKDEIVGIGAHLDHIGTNSEGVIYYGADDDGSGSTALIAIARALSLTPQKPKRSVLFMAYCGEEMGLIGSGYYVNHPIFPLNKMTCHFQMDMVGRNEEGPNDKPEDNIDTTHLVGSKRLSMELHNLILDANQHVNFKFEYDEEGVYTRSDHYMFASNGVPIAFIFSGFHKDYHQPTDTVEKINFEKLANAAKLFYISVYNAANLDHMLKKDGKG